MTFLEHFKNISALFLIFLFRKYRSFITDDLIVEFLVWRNEQLSSISGNET